MSKREVNIWTTVLGLAFPLGVLIGYRVAHSRPVQQTTTLKVDGRTVARSVARARQDGQARL